ncbi:MAG: hypothetical protein J3Q66DRAFT_429683, partial [Benniella sp.]
ARRHWTTQDRDRLETLALTNTPWPLPIPLGPYQYPLALTNTPWPMIAKELQRNQGSCREKWFRIQKKCGGQTLRQTATKCSLESVFQGRFRTHHRDKLMKAIERQLKEGRSMLASDHTHDPLRLLDMVGYGQDEGPLEMMMTGRITPQARHEGHRTDTGTLSTKDGSQGIDWNVIA